jgi:hypothetical protein
MNPPTLTRFLYLKEEVKYSLLFSLLKRENLNECIFWCSELYYSGFYEELWKFLNKIYYDFYAINNPKLEKFISKMKEKWKKKRKIVYLLHIIKNFYVLENINPLVFLIRMCIETQKSKTKSYQGRPPKWLMDIKADKKYKDLLLSIDKKHYKNIAYYLRRFRNNEDELFQIIVNYYKNKSKGDVKMYNGEDKMHNLIATMMHLSLEESVKREIRVKITKEELEYGMNTNKINVRLYKVLKEKRLFKISSNIGCFELRNYNSKYPNIQDIQWHHWEYFSYNSPLWKERFDKYKIIIDHEKFLISFEDDDEYEEFSEKYYYEPDEQSKEVQERSIGAIVDISINDWLTIIFGEYKLLELDNKKKYIY